MHVVGHVVIGRAFAGPVLIAAAALLLTGGSAYALSAPAPAAAASAGARCMPGEAMPHGACVLQVRGGMGGGGGGHHASAHRGGHASAKSPTVTARAGAGALGNSRNKRIVNNRIMATDGNVTTGPNVAVTRDINDRRAVLLNDGRVVVLSDRRAAVLNGTSGVLIRFHGG